jgi:hypothetical protein
MPRTMSGCPHLCLGLATTPVQVDAAIEAVSGLV